MIVSKGYNGDNVPYNLAFNSTSQKFSFSAWTPVTVGRHAVGSTVATAGKRYHLTGSFDGTSFLLYENGREDARTTWTGSLPSNTQRLGFGDADWEGSFNTYQYSGVIDEVRISSVARSSNWVWACYLNQASNAVFSQYGAMTAPSGLTIQNAAVTSVTTNSATFNGMLTSTGTSACAVCVLWGTNNAGQTWNWANTNWFNNGAVNGDWTNNTPFTTNITSGIDPNKNYYYTYAATNATTNVVASGPIAFITGEVWIDRLSHASEIGPAPGTFTVHRASAATNEELTVNYTVGGTASKGDDYTTLSGAIAIPAGADSAALVVSPILDGFLEGTETVSVTIISGAYPIGTSSNATLEIADSGMISRTWNGAGANNLASTPGNWVGGVAPVAGDGIVLDATTNKNMTWDLNIAVGDWTQNAGYSGTVTFMTTYSGTFTNFAVVGNLKISGGRWTHTGNSTTNAYRVSVTVGGAFTLETNAVIDVDARGYGDQYGPGSLPWVEAWDGPRDGGAHGGVGGYTGFATNQTRTYDSVLAPWMPGSGAGGRGGTGGGVVWLAVTGSATVDGTITANGSGWEHFGSGAGGSLYLSCASLAGTGTLRANGGDAGEFGGGGGGRIAVVLSAGDFAAAPTMSALGGTANSYKGAAGTIYREAASDGLGRGAVTVNNNGIIVSTNVVNTSLPPYNRAYDSDNLAGTAWAVTNGGYVSLTGDTRLRSLSIDSINSALWLEGRVLTLKDSLTVTGKVYSAGTYTASQLGSLVHDSVGSGQVIISGRQGTVITIR